MKISILISSLVVIMASCNTQTEKPDAYGNFESTETIISAESNGKLLTFTAEEGKQVQQGEIIAVVDTTILHKQREVLLANFAASQSRKPDTKVQLQVIEQQLKVAETQVESAQREYSRILKLLEKGAATQKQRDDIKTQFDIAQKQRETLTSQLKAQQSGLSIQTTGISKEGEMLQKQLEQLEAQIQQCIIRAPISGIITATYAEQSEVVTFAKPLCKIANLSTMIMRAYVSGDQLGSFALGQNVTVRIDAPEGSYKNYSGNVTWVSSKAEFTPKIIQTKEDRVNFVYAVKIAVQNDGAIKMGMPAEVLLR